MQFHVPNFRVICMNNSEVFKIFSHILLQMDIPNNTLDNTIVTKVVKKKNANFKTDY